MRSSALLTLLVLLVLTRLAGAWEITRRATLPSTKGIGFQRITVAQSDQEAEVHLVSFRPSKHRVVVLDDPNGDRPMSAAAKESGALAAINGGYFHPDRRPLGLVMSEGKKLHGFEKARLLSGLILAGQDRVSIVRAGQYQPAKWIRDALQAGPFLIDGGKPVAGLNSQRAAARTFVLTTADGEWAAIGICKWVTLAEMAEILALPDLLLKMKITRALNLDGGSSTGLWVRQGDDAFHIREGREVRNYLAIVPEK